MNASEKSQKNDFSEIIVSAVVDSVFPDSSQEKE